MTLNCILGVAFIEFVQIVPECILEAFSLMTVCFHHLSITFGVHKDATALRVSEMRMVSRSKRYLYDILSGTVFSFLSDTCLTSSSILCFSSRVHDKRGCK